MTVSATTNLTSASIQQVIYNGISWTPFYPSSPHPYLFFKQGTKYVEAALYSSDGTDANIAEWDESIVELNSLLNRETAKSKLRRLAVGGSVNLEDLR